MLTLNLCSKIDKCLNNPEKYSTTKTSELIPCEYTISTIWTFDSAENKHSLYPGEDCMKNLCSSLKEHATNIIKFEKNKMLLLTKKRTKITSRCNNM